MGVPSFYRWLISRYESIVVNAKEEKGEFVDSSLPNPNGMEFDNLYLDMNGIIHPCFHPEDDDNMCAPKTFDQVFLLIFAYIDRIFNIVRPRKLLYLAIDGVAPRGKMNQQRARRFRTAKDAGELENLEESLRRLFLLEGKQVLPKQETELSDSNIITPGTEFMFLLSNELQSYIQNRMNDNLSWKDIKVILSDASVPGEGEHKIFSFIRLQRTYPEYDQNTRHCVYGLDADLIMLVLATHEVHFSILREDMLAVEQNSGWQTTQIPISEPVNQKKSRGWFKKWETGSSESGKPEEQSSLKATDGPKLVKRPYQFLNIWILREYLEIDMAISDPPEKFEPDIERLIDDFIFICFFTGNDFLPHMPSLYIHEGAIDLLMHVYKTEFKNLGGYLVDMQRVDDTKLGFIKLKRVEKFILLVGNYEEKIFKKRADLRERNLKRILREYEDSRETENQEREDNDVDLESMQISGTFSDRNHTSNGIGLSDNDPEVILQNTKELKEKLKAYSRKAADSFQNGGPGTDKVKLNLPGHKQRYYQEKFGATNSADVENTRRTVVEKYGEGLCWVTIYYFSGVPSWTWYYPYHYGPFASDMKGLSQIRPNFQKGLPFKPFEQLMGVLPPKSAHALPPAYQKLMIDDNSSITDFYPRDFTVDCDGKRFLWQGICKLRFIEEDRLLAETRKLECELKADEVIRNSEFLDQLFLQKTSSQIMSNEQVNDSIKPHVELKIDANLSGGLNGFVLPKTNEYAFVYAGDKLSGGDDSIIHVFYKLPPHRVHIPCILKGVVVPEKTISESDIFETQLWHEYHHRRPDYRMKQNQPRQLENVKKLTNSTPVPTVKGAGVGWGGRGKVIAEEIRRMSIAPGETVRTTCSSSSFSSNSRRIGYSRQDDFHSPSQHEVSNINEKWKPSGYGRGDIRREEVFTPNPPDVWQARNSGIWETRGAVQRPHNQLASISKQPDVWRGRNSGIRETRGAVQLRPNNQPATTHKQPVVWRARNSGIEETRAAVQLRPSYQPATFNLPLQQGMYNTNEDWRPSSYGRGRAQATGMFRPNQPEVYNVRQVIAKGDAQYAERSTSSRPENYNVWRASGRGSWTSQPNQPADNNAWQVRSSSGRGGSWRSGESP